MNNRIGQRIITECLQLPAVLFSYLVRAVALSVNKDRTFLALFLPFKLKPHFSLHLTMFGTPLLRLLIPCSYYLDHLEHREPSDIIFDFVPFCIPFHTDRRKHAIYHFRTLISLS